MLKIIKISAAQRIKQETINTRPANPQSKKRELDENVFMKIFPRLIKTEVG